MRKQTWKAVVSAAAIAATAMAPSWAGLVARWDFNNYDPENPRSAAILAPTVGNLAAIPCSGKGTSTAITDGTLGNSITVVGADQAPGLADGDYALNIPSGSHLKMPLPAGIVRDKEWMVRIRFYVPAGAGHQRSLIQPDYGNAADKLYFVNGYNLIRAREAEFGTSQFENKNNHGILSRRISAPRERRPLSTVSAPCRLSRRRTCVQVSQATDSFSAATK